MAAIALTIAALVLAPTSSAAAPKHPPHVIFLLADDLGWNNVGWHSNITLTPHLDALASGGVRLTQHYAQRWCAPSRTALMTFEAPRSSWSQCCVGPQFHT